MTLHPELQRLQTMAQQSGFGRANLWVKIGKCDIYLRIGPRFVDGDMVRCLQLATITVPEKHQNKGHFSKALIQCAATGLPLFVENVHPIRLRNSLQKCGFRIIKTYMDGLVVDMFREAETGQPDQIPS